MEQTWLAVSIAAGVVFGFMISWVSLRSDRAGIYARGKSEGENERVAMEERLQAKDLHIQEITDERGREREAVERMREENAALRAAQTEVDARIALLNDSHQELLRVQGEKARAEIAAQLATAAAAIERFQEQQQSLGSLSGELDRTRREAADLRSENSRLQAYAAELDARIAESRRMAGEKRREPLPDAPAGNARFEALIQPLRESLERVGASLTEMERNRTSELDGLTQQVATLAGAFHVPAARGVWSELQLRRVVELAGLSERCDFDRTPGADAPGLVVHLPGNRHIAVDAALSAEDCLRGQGDALRAHVDRLAGAGKDWEFTVAFLPADSILGAALEHDPALIDHAAERKVLMATPTTLIALLKTVAYGWQQYEIAGNARQLQELGRALYERTRAFAGHFDQLRRHLVQTLEAYNVAAASLETRVLAGARQFEDLGVARGKPLAEPESIEATPRSLRALDTAVDPAPALA